MIKLAQYYDYKFEYIIDNNMCTDVCPCYSQNHPFSNINQNDDKKDPYKIYGGISERYLLIHNRTWSKVQTSNIKSFVWSNDPSNSFSNFKDCLNYWTLKS